MSTVAKILVVLNLVLAGFFLASASNYLGQQDSYRDQLDVERAAHEDTRSTLNTKVTELEGSLRSQAADMNKLRGERSVSQAEAQRLEAQAKHLTEAYDQLAENSTRSQRSVDQLTNSISSLRSLNDALTTDNRQLRDALTQSQNDRDAKVAMVNTLQLQLNNETERANALEANLAAANEKNQRQAFQLQAIAERFPGSVVPEQPMHHGRVLAANNNDNVFVISLGEEDGVKPGFQYTVSRGSQYIATIQITDVQAKQSAGRAIRGLSKGRVQRSDKVMSGR